MSGQERIREGRESMKRALNAVEACGHSKGPFDACKQCIARAIDEAVAARALFQSWDFHLHSGARSTWKVECDNLTPADWETLAHMAVEVLPPFGAIEGVPRGGLALAGALQAHATAGPLLIVDDVLTTGASMEAQRAGRGAIGLVVFARGRCPSWVTALWSGHEAVAQERQRAQAVVDATEDLRTAVIAADQYEPGVAQLGSQERMNLAMVLGQSVAALAQWRQA